MSGSDLASLGSLLHTLPLAAWTLGSSPPALSTLSYDWVKTVCQVVTSFLTWLP